MKNGLAWSLMAALIGGCAVQPVDVAQPPQPEEALAFAGGKSRSQAQAAALGVKAMSLQELKGCAGTAVSIRETSTTLPSERKNLNAAKAKIEADQVQLEADRKKVSATSSKQVDAFNARLKQLREGMRSFNARIDAFNASLQRANELSNSFNLNCAERPYRIVDLATLTESERQAMEAGAQPFDLPVYSDEPTPEGADTLLTIP